MTNLVKVQGLIKFSNLMGITYIYWSVFLGYYYSMYPLFSFDPTGTVTDNTLQAHIAFFCFLTRPLTNMQIISGAEWSAKKFF